MNNCSYVITEITFVNKNFLLSVFGVSVVCNDEDDDEHDQGCDGTDRPDYPDNIVLYACKYQDARNHADNCQSYLQIQQIVLIRETEPFYRTAVPFSFESVRQMRAIRIESYV